ncbi:MAG: Rne/Rng family ribonuclease [Gammaproteobacteria bacterium]|jgi:ribonuclease E|nr:ribonuclease E/G [Gammaproteobacteria bacterium]MDP6146493.1 Rne/Rng family ribonuclease [Gammaproteobacteria bacterium]HJL80771.1 Rne/Rng family ribonuclease [Gammaproteobacteria bacterium]HJN01377.1 Rne/Rng family ribonuclease [Gammaproteobacteria bacterium]|tara:strand:- start:12118 stop:14307 length:2190 start_codon:yes stop_codon:yes gene_type:complete
MKRILINATQQEELRVAMVDGQKLYNLDIEYASGSHKKNNIYKGKITRIEPSLDSIFVDFGSEKNGFLPFREVSREYYLTEPIPGDKHNIKNLFEEGQEIVVQVVKEERGTKGAALTTYLSLAGRFMVFKPNNPKGGGISRKITGRERLDTFELLDQLDQPDGSSIIVRTAGVGRSLIELQWDLNYLAGIWDSIKKLALDTKPPALIFKENSLIARSMRDHLEDDVGEIIIDDEDTYENSKKYIKQVSPKNLKKLKHYSEATPLFTRFQIENQIESAYSNQVRLPSGGTVVIDYTEALISIDINSGRATKESDIESTALQTNLEAAEEIARQCRLRDMGGLIVIDFIDMRRYKNQKAVENAMRSAVRKDRARVSVGGISRFGLMEMSRQRLRPSLDDSAYKICPHCNGIGKVRSTESLALSVLRLVGEEARKEKTKSVIANIPSDATNYLMNEKREWINEIEEREKIDIVLTADPELSSVNFTITRVRTDGTKIQHGSNNTQVHSHGNDRHRKGDESGNRLNTDHEPVKAWDIEDMKGPNLMDKIKFWFASPPKKKKTSTKRKQQPRKKPSENRSRKQSSSSRRKTKPNRKPKSNASRSEKETKKQNNKSTKGNKRPPKKQPQSSKVKPDEKENQKKTTKQTDKTSVKKNVKNKSDTAKKPTKKAEAKKPRKKNIKNDKSSSVKKKEPKGKVSKKVNVSDSKKPSKKNSKVSKASTDKVLPWEDIVPPK